MKKLWNSTDMSTKKLHSAPRFLVLLFIIIFVCLGCSYTERVMPESTQQDFTFVIFPDTQYMVGPDYGGMVPDSGAKKEVTMWGSMCRWVVDHQNAENIQAVLSVGDVTDYASDAEFKIASEGYDAIDDAGIPYVPIVGNHDYDHVYPKKREVSNFDRYFGPHRFEEKNWYGGCLDGSHANYYVRLTADRWRFLIVALEFFPRQHAVEWASDIIDAHPDAQAIILTHAYLNPDGTRTKRTDRWSISRYGLEDSYSGEELWEGLIKSKPNILVVICGHQPDGPYAAHRTDPGDAGNGVHQIFIDYQSSNGGDGWIGLLKFRPSLGIVEMSSYRTYAPSGLGYDPNAPTYSLPWPGVSRASVSGD